MEAQKIKIELNEDTQKKIIELWHEVFPNSHMGTSRLCLGKGFWFRGILASGKHECSGGYFENDNMRYTFMLDEDGYNGENASICLNPKTQYLYCSTECLRKKSIKDVSFEKIKARFEQIKEFIVLHKDNILKNEFYNIDDKI